MKQGAAKFRQFVLDLAWLSLPLRVVLLLLVGAVVLIGSSSWAVPGFSTLEHLAHDARARLSVEKRSEEESVVLVVYDKMTAAETNERNPIDRSLLANALKVIDDAEPLAIGIILPFDAPQDDDSVLLAAFQETHVPIFISAVGNDYSAELESEGLEYAQEFAIRLPDNVRLANTRIGKDNDGVVRSWPRLRDDGLPAMAALLAQTSDAKIDFTEYEGGLRFTEAFSNQFSVMLSPADFPEYSMLGLLMEDADIEEFYAEGFKGKIVLIGSHLPDVERYVKPISQTDSLETATSVEIQAHMLSQALDGAKLYRFPALGNFALTVVSILLGAGVSILSKRKIYAGIAILAVGWLYLAVAVWWQVTFGDTRNLGLIGWVFVTVSLAAIIWFVRYTSGFERGRTATLALHRYLPPEIAESIVTRPDRLGLEGETRNVVVMFTDLEGFTGLCQSLEAGVVAEFLNDYLEEISQVVLAHGGTIDKFVGDAVVAFWGAPISHSDDAERAVRASIEILKVTENYRGKDLGGDAMVGRTRIGLHSGPAIVGNFGGDGRLQYTALGDTMNVAARLEGANKELGTSILLSGDLFAQVRQSIPCRTMGKIFVRGRTMAVEIFEPSLNVPPEQLARLNAFSDAALSGNSEALHALEQWSIEHPEDVGVAHLVRRIKDDGAE